jgi:hypothetical protein
MLTRAVARPAWPTRVVPRRIEQSPPGALNYGEDEKSHPLNFDSPKPRRQPLPRSSPCDHRPVHWSSPLPAWAAIEASHRGQHRQMPRAQAHDCEPRAPSGTSTCCVSQHSPHTHRRAPSTTPTTQREAPFLDLALGVRVQARQSDLTLSTKRRRDGHLEYSERSTPRARHCRRSPRERPEAKGAGSRRPHGSVWAWPDRKGRHGCRGELLPAASKGACRARRDANCSRSMI